LIYFIPYVYLFIAFLIHRRTEATPETVKVPGGPATATVVGVSGLLVTLFAMGVAMIPPGDETQPMIFELKVVGGAIAFVALGGLVYWRAHRIAARQNATFQPQ